MYFTIIEIVVVLFWRVYWILCSSIYSTIWISSILSSLQDSAYHSLLVSDTFNGEMASKELINCRSVSTLSIVVLYFGSSKEIVEDRNGYDSEIRSDKRNVYTNFFYYVPVLNSSPALCIVLISLYSASSEQHNQFYIITLNVLHSP